MESLLEVETGVQLLGLAVKVPSVAPVLQQTTLPDVVDMSTQGEVSFASFSCSTGV